MRPPNILYIHSHDTGRFIQPYGCPFPTPNLQRLAEGGVTFRQAHNMAPTCSPSRAALVTGQAPHSCGMLGLAHIGFLLADYNDHLVHRLKAAGYTTALSGVQHVAAQAETIGYDRVIGTRHDAEERACEFLADAPDRPFFLSVGFHETHRVFPEPDRQDDPRWMPAPPHQADSPEVRADMAALRKSVRTLDAKMGRVFQALEDNDLAENTLVIATTDHGIAFPRMKCNLHDGGTGVFLIMRGPGGFTGGRVVDALVSHVDLFPTICEVAGIEPPERLQGVSLAPLARGEVDSVRDAVYAEVNWHAAVEPMRSVRTTRYKYIRRYDGRRSPVLPNCDNSPSKTQWTDAGWADTPPEPEMLYDLIFDPSETNNLLARPEYRTVLDDMRGRLENWMRETNDPLLTGEMIPPEGAVGVDPDDYAPASGPRLAQQPFRTEE